MLHRDQLERFVNEYADRAYRFAYSLCGNEADARELVQEAFVKLFDKSDCYDPQRSLESWFMTILKNLFVDGTRRWERRNGISLATPVGDEGLTVADCLPDVAEEALLERLERNEKSQHVRGALAELRPELRAVLVLVDAEGLGYEQAAHALQWPLGTVRSRLNRARAALKSRLLNRGV